MAKTVWAALLGVADAQSGAQSGGPLRERIAKRMEQRAQGDVQRQRAPGAQTLSYGSDPARQKALSPVFHAAAPNAPRFLLLHVQREDGVAQAQELGAALKKAGTSVEFGSFPGKGLQGHAEINRKLGEPDYAATPVMDAWLKAVFGGEAT